MEPITIQNKPTHRWVILEGIGGKVQVKRQPLNVHGAPLGRPEFRGEFDTPEEAAQAIAINDAD